MVLTERGNVRVWCSLAFPELLGLRGLKQRAPGGIIVISPRRAIFPSLLCLENIGQGFITQQDSLTHMAEIGRSSGIGGNFEGFSRLSGETKRYPVSSEQRLGLWSIPVVTVVVRRQQMADRRRKIYSSANSYIHVCFIFSHFFTYYLWPHLLKFAQHGVVRLPVCCYRVRCYFCYVLSGLLLLFVMVGGLNVAWWETWGILRIRENDIFSRFCESIVIFPRILTNNSRKTGPICEYVQRFAISQKNCPSLDWA